ncbi:MAG TPA: Gmad2 immunoglobulin-like domain-containing protein [Actinomycetes bacterium]|nr:Gmad2 immunoglobulin-like domain-containing protein [Actinomycetes bacterium]
MTYDDDELAARLRRALHAEAEMVNPRGDGLSQIRGRTAGRGSPGLMRWAVGAAAAVVIAAVGVGAGVMWSNQSDGQGAIIASTPSGATSAPAPTPSESGSASPLPGTRVTVPVYWLGDAADRPGLYREFASVLAVDASTLSKVQVAVSQALFGTPADPDYSTPWAKGSVATVTLGADEIGIDLNKAATDGSSMGSQIAQLAVQQLVWTATAAAGENLPVRITVEGATPDLFGTVSLAEPIRRADPAYEALANIWILTPTQGQAVSGAVTATGQATVHEANLLWQLLKGSTVVRNDFTTASEGGPGRGDWTIELGTLDPGTYTLRAYAESPKGDGSLQGEDTKTFTVK